MVDQHATFLNGDLATQIMLGIRRWIYCGCRVEFCFCCAGLIDDHSTALFYDHSGVIANGQLSTGGVGSIFDSQRRIVSNDQAGLPLFCIVGDLDIKTVDVQNDRALLRPGNRKPIQNRNFTDHDDGVIIIVIMGNGLLHGPEVHVFTHPVDPL